MLQLTVKRLIRTVRHSQHVTQNVIIVLLLMIAVVQYRGLVKSMDRISFRGYFDAALKDTSAERLRIDWHDYGLMAQEAKRVGLGEHGVRAQLHGKANDRQRELYAANGYDGYLSDLISVNRSVPDVRPQGCKTRKYISKLPKVSAIIPVYNEHFSIVMRTAHSIMNRAQGDLVREVIFVNDKSDPQFLNSTFDEYVARNFKGRGRVLHLKKKAGLIQARMAGARVATSDVLLFSDAHTEATINYLPPLLEPIAENYRVCTVPIEDPLDVHNFEYPQSEGSSRIIFDWWINYVTVPVPPENVKDPSKPFKTPVMRGGLFAISAKFFWELDGYDDQLEIWGGEQYEISFKIWMCGGEMYMVPCSHFGHMFRTENPVFKNPRPYDYITRNYKRVIEVWMDEYKQYIYDRDPKTWSLDPGLLLRQRALRAKLKCKSFKWYLDNVAPEILQKFPVKGAPWFARGWVRSKGVGWLCIDTLNEDHTVGLYPCDGTRTQPNYNQRFELSFHRDIAHYGTLEADCIQPQARRPGAKLVKTACTQRQGVQFWKYDLATKALWNDRNGEYCMECDPVKQSLFLNVCNTTNIYQKWEWGAVNRTMLAGWETMGAVLV